VLLVIWVFVLWGTLLIFALVASVFAVGPGESLARLLPGRGATALHYLNAASVLLALMAWAQIGLTLVLGRKGRS
jgi:hypothetical protein